ncbi:hypothetical protein BXZ70DRAFT_907607 [Cristinia sonorae]|uniref:Alpha-type protein kinase domain-containing protein n=1 Tax=Cristinia sonorae TaxID=1940300 RepID=A0A8K0UNI6_9AGAR|nr:hypothetical protein BXZ70DRAFT_907607 [Cristinia sonorae]
MSSPAPSQPEPEFLSQNTFNMPSQTSNVQAATNSVAASAKPVTQSLEQAVIEADITQIHLTCQRVACGRRYPKGATENIIQDSTKRIIVCNDCAAYYENKNARKTNLQRETGTLVNEYHLPNNGPGLTAAIRLQESDTAVRRGIAGAARGRPGMPVQAMGRLAMESPLGKVVENVAKIDGWSESRPSHQQQQVGPPPMYPPGIPVVSQTGGTGQNHPQVIFPAGQGHGYFVSSSSAGNGLVYYSQPSGQLVFGGPSPFSGPVSWSPQVATPASHTSGPNVHVQGHSARLNLPPSGHSMQPPPVPVKAQKQGGSAGGSQPAGYTDNHQVYDPYRKGAAQRSFSKADRGEILVDILVWDKVHNTKKEYITKEAIGAVKTDISLHDLHLLCFDTLEPLWKKHTTYGGFEIKAEDFELRTKDLSLVQDTENRGPLKSYFYVAHKTKAEIAFKKPRSPPQFHFELKHGTYKRLQTWIENQEYIQESQNFSTAEKRTRDVLSEDEIDTLAKKGRKKTSESDSESLDTANNLEVLPRFVLPDPGLMAAGMLAQEPPQRKVAKKLTNTPGAKKLLLTFHALKSFDTLDELNKQVLGGLWKKGDEVTIANIPILVPEEQEITVTLSDRPVEKGTFKTTWFGTLDRPIFLSSGKQENRRRVVLKQITDTIPMTKGAPSRSKERDQLQDLLPELQVHAYAATLFRLFNSFVADRAAEMRGNGTLIPYHPHYQFVHAGLAFHDTLSAGNSTRIPYLVEQELVAGQFKKYINNSRPRMLESLEGEERLDTEWLLFSQHVIWWITGKLCFITDYQGSGGLLTDAQIISDPNLGDNFLFAQGNIPNAYLSFEREHQCNSWCDLFQVEKNWDRIERASDS